MVHTLAFHLSSHRESFNAKIGISLTKEGEGKSGRKYRHRGKKFKWFLRNLKLYHPSLNLPYNCSLFVHSVPEKKKLFIDGAIVQAVRSASSPQSCEVTLPKPMVYALK